MQARVVAEAELSAKTCALSANRGLSSLASEGRPLIFGSARRRRGRGGAWRDAKCCGSQVTTQQRKTQSWDTRAWQRLVCWRAKL